MKITKEQRKLIDEAKGLYQAKMQAKWRICEICYQVCDIVVGGHLNKSGPSMADFAREIGMHRKTLNQWMIQYRKVFMKLDKTMIPDLLDAMKASTFNGAVDRVSEIVGYDEPPQIIEALVKKELKRNKSEREFATFYRMARTLTHQIEQQKVKGLSLETVDKVHVMFLEAEQALIKLKNKLMKENKRKTVLKKKRIEVNDV